MQVSILQALSLLNGEWISEQTGVDSPSVRAVAEAPFFTDERRIETLFLATLSRPPTAVERDRYLAHLKSAANQKQALSDVLWTLLNSQEFLVNH
jgi:hypothetical protein